MSTPKRAPQARSAQRRQDIVQASLESFFRLGYEATSVNSIIASLGISKGSFYHHFSGKEGVLNAALESQLELATKRMNLALADPAMTGVDLLNLALAAAWQEPGTSQAGMAQTTIALLKPDNATILNKLIAIERRVAEQIATKIITRGMTDGSFVVEDPAIASNALYSTTVGVLLDTFRALLGGQIDAQMSKNRLRFLYQSMERILGAPVGSLVGGLAETLQLFDTLERSIHLPTHRAATTKPAHDIQHATSQQN